MSKSDSDASYIYYYIIISDDNDSSNSKFECIYITDKLEIKNVSFLILTEAITEAS